MAIIKGAKNAEVVPPAQQGNLSWNKPAKSGLVPVKVGDKNKGRKKSFSRKVARQATQEYVNEKSRQAAKGSNNKSKQPNPLRFANRIHHSVTGTNSAFSRANPNLIFVGTLGLIVASGISSKRIQNIFHDALNPNDAIANHPQRMWRSLKVIGVQLIFAFGVTFFARLSSGFAGFMLVVIIGIWILWLLRNPEIFQLLSAISQDDTTSQQGSISTLAAQLNNTPISPSNLYPGSIFPQNPNTTTNNSPTPSPIAPNAIYQNVLKALKGSGGGSRGVR